LDLTLIPADDLGLDGDRETSLASENLRELARRLSMVSAQDEGQ